MSTGRDRPAVRVVKLGGSLLEFDDLAPRLQAWLALQRPAASVLIVGGGRFADALRAWDRRHPIAAETMHWLAVRAMGLTAQLVAELLPAARLINRIDALPLVDAAGEQQSGVQILDVEQFLRDDSRSSDALPCGWQVTSDSIAARVAARIDADELVLFKSTLPAGPCELGAWSRGGFVDEYFATAAIGLAIRAVNLRDAEFAEVRIAPSRIARR